MEFLKVLVRGVALLPTVIQGVETLYGAQAGAEKRAAALSVVRSAISVDDAGRAGKIVDPAKFAASLGMIVDGLVGCLNASVWAK